MPTREVGSFKLKRPWSSYSRHSTYHKSTTSGTVSTRMAEVSGLLVLEVVTPRSGESCSSALGHSTRSRDLVQNSVCSQPFWIYGFMLNWNPLATARVHRAQVQQDVVSLDCALLHARRSRGSGTEGGSQERIRSCTERTLNSDMKVACISLGGPPGSQRC